MPAGRPSSYKPEYAEELIEYFSREPFEIATNSQGEPFFDKHGNAVEIPSAFPTKAGFATHIGVHRDTLKEWASVTHIVDGKEVPKHPEFSVAYKRAQDFQENMLVQNALRGNYQANFSIFTAKNVLGWRDQKHIDHTTKGEKVGIAAMSDDELEEIAKGE